MNGDVIFTAMKKKRSDTNVQQNGTFFDPMALTWTEKYDKQLTKFWSFIPESVGKVFITLAVFMFGVSINGKRTYLYFYVNLFSMTRIPGTASILMKIILKINILLVDTGDWI